MQKMCIKYIWIPAKVGAASNELTDHVANEAAQHEAMESPTPYNYDLSIIKRQITIRCITPGKPNTLYKIENFSSEGYAHAFK